MKNSILIFSLQFCLLICAYSQKWEWTYPRPTGNKLYSISFVSPDTGFVVGDHGTVLRTYDGGSQWQDAAGNVIAALKSVTFVSNLRWFIVGDDGVILRTSNCGETWTNCTFDPDIDFNGVDFYSDQSGYIVGYKHSVSKSRIYRTLDGGDSWELQYEVPNYLISVSFPGPNTVFAANSDGMVYSSNDGGTTWQGSDLGHRIYGCDFGDSLHGVAVGYYDEPNNEYFIDYTYDGGQTWHSAVNQAILGYYENVSFCGPLTAYVIASGYSDGTIFRTTDGGASWDKVSGSPGFGVNRIFFANDSVGYCTGRSSLISRTEDAGNSWQAKSSTLLTDDHNTVCIAGPNTVYVSGKKSLLKTDNNGQDWFKLSSPIGGFYEHTVFFIDEQHGFTGDEDGQMYNTKDGGASWGSHHVTNKWIHAITVPTGSDSGFVVGSSSTVIKFDVDHVNYHPKNLGTPDAILYSINFPTPETGYIAGNNGMAWKTTDGGNHWTLLNTGTSHTLNSTFFLDVNIGFLVGDAGIILKTENGGINWTQKNSGTSANLYSICFHGSDFGYIVGDLGMILHSNNEGNTWNRVASPTYNSLMSVQIYDTNMIYIAGKGSILNYLGNSFTDITQNDYTKQNHIIISPNPVNDFLYIDIPGIAAGQEWDVSIFSIDARLVRRYSHIEFKKKIDVSWLKPGIYILQIQNNPYIQAGKFIKL